MLSESLKRECKRLVDRARHGDQNAMAMIEQIAKNAKGGLGLAQESHQAILDYSQAGQPQMNGETANVLSSLKNPNISPDILLKILCFIPNLGDGLALHAAVVILSKGPLWPTARVAAVQAVTPQSAVPALQQGLAAPSPTVTGEFDYGPHNCYYSAGAIIGSARRIQAVRGGSPLAFLSPCMGWELD